MTMPPLVPRKVNSEQQKTWPQFWRFLCVGLVNTFVGLTMVYACKYFGGMGDLAANASGYALGLCVSFTLNRKWTFAHHGAIGPAAARFLAVAGIAYAMNLLTVMLCIHGLGINGYLAQALGIPPYTLTAYVLSRAWAFRMEPSE
jgi:putative flippase GtrA